MTTEERYLSHSQIQSYKDCGEQYRLRYVEHAERRPNTAAVGGIAVHAATEVIDKLILQGVKAPEALTSAATEEAESALAREIERISERTPDYVDPATWAGSYGRRSKEWPNAQDLTYFRAVAIPNAITNYVGWRLQTLDLQPLEIDGFGPAIELPIEWKLGDRAYHGYIDRIFQKQDTGICTIMDLKNGPKPKTSAQLGAYAFAMRQMFPEGNWRWGNFLTGLKYPPNPTTPKRGAPSKAPQQLRLSMPIDLNYWTEETLLASSDPVVRAMDQGIYIPNPGDVCQLCPFTDICRFFTATAV